MLRITTAKDNGSFTLILEGRLCGAWTREAEKAWSRLLADCNGESLAIDLGGVTFIDQAGETWLASVLAQGARVRASGVLIRHIVEQVGRRLPV